MSLYLIVRFVHIAGAILFVGGLAGRQLVRSVAARAGDVQALLAITQAAGRVERIMVIPGNSIVVVFGIILALMTKAPLLGFLQGSPTNWLLISLVVLLLGGAVVPLVFVPRGKMFEKALVEAVASGKITPEVEERLHDRTVALFHTLELAAVIFVMILMVFKPF